MGCSSGSRRSYLRVGGTRWRVLTPSTPFPTGCSSHLRGHLRRQERQDGRIPQLQPPRRHDQRPHHRRVCYHRALARRSERLLGSQLRILLRYDHHGNEQVRIRSVSFCSLLCPSSIVFAVLPCIVVVVDGTNHLGDPVSDLDSVVLALAKSLPAYSFGRRRSNSSSNPRSSFVQMGKRGRTRR